MGLETPPSGVLTREAAAVVNVLAAAAPPNAVKLFARPAANASELTSPSCKIPASPSNSSEIEASVVASLVASNSAWTPASSDCKLPPPALVRWTGAAASAASRDVANRMVLSSSLTT